MSETKDSRQIVVASASALLFAALLLVTAVLPAEYGWDPLGTGKALGLMGMSESTSNPLRVQASEQKTDRIEFQLAPFESLEYKYRLEEGDSILFQWRANGEVLYEMHAEPDGAAPGYAESFEKTRGVQSTGSYTAPFPGIHGWYWQNRGQKDVVVTLESSGFFSAAKEFRDGREFEYLFQPGSGKEIQP